MALPQTESCTTPRFMLYRPLLGSSMFNQFRGARDLRSLRNQIDPSTTMASSATRELS
jgi:hypothetical protein